ncbi:TPA: alpha/beta fold hydrolase [Aeromonas hydrophila]|uniref:alpha/beta hydrolase n=1 Tax=Aeromonas TaxID=642 RepID=UPI00090AC27D|nr:MULTISPECIES: alpha/beta fold hydrolase [Aeromonas]HEB4991476.1 alpha/beta fold hydrolase [Aeromonas hydrophila subsp. hydrophila]APJ14466.1 alpha/beta hydrolase [Aeromonas hydrophila]MCK0183753.1 alpha/beta fold hydrolase [Aeromonas hydrophila]UBQ49666.1 alpha/beta fold hydrolase [Aeromonas hydrophila]UCM56553.1 alpha/beta fold hydrolase [Aeromonas hydrophila]
MSSKIYFNTRRFSPSKWLLGLGTRLHHTLAPAHAKRTASKLLLTPQRNQRDDAAPAGLVKQAVHTSEGTLMSYRLGQGPVWLLMHGWSGSAGQFYPLMSHIAALGFTAIAYDHPAHGHSAGHTGHLPRFVRAFDELVEKMTAEYGPLQGVIAHSMGGAVTLSSRRRELDALPLLLISPVLDYVPQLYGMVARSGYSIRLFDAVVKEIEQEYQHPLSTVDPLGRLAGRSGPAIIVHDEEDRFAPHGDSLRATQDGRTRLVSTRGLGHGRILASAPAFASFDQLSAARHAN